MQWKALLLLTIAAMSARAEDNSKNVLGTGLQLCGTSPITGWYRDGYCKTDSQDHGTHVVCASVTLDFLAYTYTQGNDLTTPRGSGFPGLKAGDRWCLCALRWREALRVGKAPHVVMEATDRKALEYVQLAELESLAV